MRRRSSDLVAWPGAFGAVAVGLMVGVLMDDNAATGYVAGLLVIALSVAGYLLVRRGAFVVSTVAGLLVLYFSVFDDVVDMSDIDGDNPGIIIGVAVLIFALLVSIAGWFLPETRVLTAVIVGVIAVIGNAGVLMGLAVVASFARAFQGFSELEPAPAVYDNRTPTPTTPGSCWRSRWSWSPAGPTPPTRRAMSPSRC